MKERKWILRICGWGLGMSISLTGCQNQSLQNSQFLAELNELRQQGGQCGNHNYPSVNEVLLDPTLSEAAENHASDMERNNYFDHQDLDGGSVGDRVTAAGYRWVRVAENIALGPKDSSAALESWVDSEGHCINLRDGNITEVGLGQLGPYWVLVLADRRD